MPNIVEQARVAVALDGRDAETVLNELTAKTEEYTTALTKAYQAGDKLGMKNALKDLKDTEKELTQVHKQTFDVTKVLKDLNGTSLNDLKRAEREITAELGKMTRGTDEYVTKSKELQQVSTEIRKVKSEMQGVSEKSKETSSSVGRIKDVFAGTGLADLAGKAFGFIKNNFQDMVNSTKAGADTFEFAMAGAKAGVEYFYKSLSTGDFSNFLSNMKEAIKAGKDYAEAMDDIGERTMALSMKESNYLAANAELEIQMRNQTLSDEKRMEAAKERLENEKSLTAERIKLAKDDFKAQVDLLKQRTSLSESELLNIAQFNNQELRLEGERYNNLVKERNKLAITSTQTGSMGISIDVGESPKIKELDKEIAGFSLNAINYANALRAYGNAAGGMIDNLGRSYVATNQAIASGDENTRKVQTLLNTLLEEQRKKQEEADKIRQKELDDQKKYLQEILLMGMNATEKENNEYQERLKKAGLFNVNRKKLTADQLKALEILENQHAENLDKISKDIESKKKADQEKWNKEILQLNEETGQAVLNQLKERYISELEAAGNNLNARKAAEDKYRKDYQVAELGQLETTKALMLSLGMDTIEIEKQIQDKKLESLTQGFSNQDQSKKDHDAVAKEYNLQTLLEQEADEIAKLEEHYKNKELTSEQHELALLDIKLKYAQEYIQKYSVLVEGLGNMVQGLQDAEIAKSQTKYQTELAQLEDKHNRQLISDDTYNKQKTALEKKQQEEEKKIKKKYADQAFAMQVAQIIASTAMAAIQAYQAVVGIPFVGPFLAPIAAAAAVVYGGTQIAQAKEQRDQVKALAKGKYDVTGADDGQTYYGVPFIGHANTGIYTKPTLISERGPELVVSAPHVRNLQMNYPQVLNAIMATRVPQYADGSYASASGSASMVKDSSQTDMILSALANSINSLNYKLDNLSAKVVMDEFKQVEARYNSLKTDVSKS